MQFNESIRIYKDLASNYDHVFLPDMKVVAPLAAHSRHADHNFSPNRFLLLFEIKHIISAQSWPTVIINHHHLWGTAKDFPSVMTNYFWSR
ncbi:MAG: hypothetical protein ACOYXA_09350 [Bacteroidota bacterium]